MFQIVHTDVRSRARDLRPQVAYDGGMFGIEIIDASLLPAMAIALAAGFISLLCPCVLPVVPP
jgi:cytochrome c-type biogenesis protein